MPANPADAAVEEEADFLVRVTHVARGTSRSALDAVAEEEPLEIQLGAVSLAVVMRTPGHDADLVRGLLLGEGVVDRPEQILSVRHCTTAPGPEADGNVIRVRLRDDVAVDTDRLRHNFVASSSCGVCGRAAIENVHRARTPIDDDARFYPSRLFAYCERLRAAQPLFDRSGGLHAAGLFGPDGRLLAVREDVGRHNAVDKVMGWAFRQQRVPLRGHALLVSGRVSFEIVQKALAARVPLLAAVSAPTSLAVQLAEAAGLTLVGFLRPPRLNVYGRVDRLVEA